MSDTTISSAAFADTKPHYELLDGLRGGSSLTSCLLSHFRRVFRLLPEEHLSQRSITATWPSIFLHPFRFVIGYAYDDRLGKTMTTGNFFKRRLIRLHPMIIMGVILGAIAFLIQGSVQWDGKHVAISAVMLSTLCAMFFIPALPGARYEVRGNGEMFPLNGPSWSLFFEYIGNILYAVFIHRLSTKALTVLVVLLGTGLAGFTLFDVSGYDMIGVGWTLDGVNFLGGSLRMLFPFSLGMLLSRKF